MMLDPVEYPEHFLGWDKNKNEKNIKTKFNKKEIEFLKNLSKEINTQDNRFTASPFTYRIVQQEKQFSTDEHRYNNIGVCIGTDYWDDITGSYDYVEACISENFNKEVKIKSICQLEEYLEELGYDYSFYSWDYKDISGPGNQGGSNCFLTEKACHEFIENNKHNLSNPRSYVVHEFRNYEMEQLIKIVHKLVEIL